MSGYDFSKSTNYEDREQWLNARRAGIGGSDAAGLLGKTNWSNPWTIWADKMGILADPPEPEYITIGRLMEPVIAEMYRTSTGREVSNPGDFRIFWGEEPFQFATLDRIDENDCIVEMKNIGGIASREWKDAPPLKYQIQCQQQMKVVGADRARLAAVFGYPAFHFRMFEVERNDRFIDLMTKSQRDFWEFVENEIPPPVDGTETTTNAVSRIRANPEVVVEWTPEMIQEIDRQYIESKEAAKVADEMQKKFSNTIKSMMGEATVALVNGTRIYTFNPDSNGTRKLLRKIKGEFAI